MIDVALKMRIDLTKCIFTHRWAANLSPKCDFISCLWETLSNIVKAPDDSDTPTMLIFGTLELRWISRIYRNRVNFFIGRLMDFPGVALRMAEVKDRLNRRMR